MQDNTGHKKNMTSEAPLVAGFKKNSFIDWPGKISFVVFLGGCNFDCYYCHNRSILGVMSNVIPFVDILGYIKEQTDFIDGVVISGGEPTLHPDLISIIKEIKKLGLAIKLDTNGSNFDVLKRIVENGLVDYIAMDVKAPLEKYSDIAGKEIDTNEVTRCIDLLKNQKKLDYMFRTTLVRDLEHSDVAAMGVLLDGAEILQIQQVQNHPSWDIETAEKFKSELEKHIKSIILRGF